MSDDNQTVTEPRSAVEAASDPSHGGSVGQRTIMSGVERIKGAVQQGENAVDELEAFVASLVGDVENAGDVSVTDAKGTVSAVHGAANAVEGIFARLAGLVKRAKAAHG